MATTYQKEVLVELKKRGFKPEGYKSNGYMIVTHPSGYQTDVASTPSDHRGMKNTLKTVDRHLRLQNEARVQFLKWVWRKWGVEPGESKTCSFNLTNEIRLFMAEPENEIYRRTSTKSIANWITGQDEFKNSQPNVRGRGKRTWIISRPAPEKVVIPLEDELLAQTNGHAPLDQAYQAAFKEAISATMAEIEANEAASEELDLTQETASEKAVRLSQEDPDEPDEPREKPLTVAEIDPQLIQRLSQAFGAPFQEQLNEQTERLNFVLGEIEIVERQLAEALGTVKGLRQLLEG